MLEEWLRLDDDNSERFGAVAAMVYNMTPRKSRRMIKARDLFPARSRKREESTSRTLPPKEFKAALRALYGK